MKHIVNIIFVIVLFANIATAQTPWYLTGNAPGTTSFLGSLSGTSQPVNIKNEDNQPIKFFTNTGSGNLTPLRMIVAGGGNVGIGTLTTPQNLLHVNGGSIQITNSTTSSGSGDGLLIGQATGSSIVEINQQESAAMKLLTTATPRIHIEAGTGAGSGYVGVGNSFTNPESRLHVSQGGNEDAWFQITGNNTGDTDADGFRVGVTNSSTATSQSVEIRQQEDADMNFHTNSTFRMTIKRGGFVGIGYTGPSYQLDVDGDIGMGSRTAIYMRDAANPGATRIFTVLADASGAADGLSNVSVGENAGPVNTTLDDTEQNVFVGYNAGTSNTGDKNTFVGPGAGLDFSSISGTENIFMGYLTADNMTAGSQNVIIGPVAATAGSFSGDKNNIIGYHAGNNLSAASADNNVMIGETSGTQVTGGDNNVFLGPQTGTSSSGARQGSTALGYNAKVDCNDCVSIGYTDTQHGFGTTDPSAYNARMVVNRNKNSGNFTYSAYFIGDTYNTGAYLPSDASLKTNVQPLTDATQVINRLSPVTYDFEVAKYPYMALPSGSQAGLISQDVENILPDLVKSTTFGDIKDAAGNIIQRAMTIKAMNYTGLIPYLVQGLKEQQAQIDALITQLNSPVNRNSADPSNSGSIELENLEGLQLQQNDPNPFSESTMIKWNLPDDFQNAMIYFYDNSGKQVNSYKLNSKGAGELQVFGSKLSSGVYTYTLVVDGKAIDTKKMMKASR